MKGHVWMAVDGDLGISFEFDVGESGSGLAFWRRLAYCIVNVPVLVKLVGEQDFRIGPEVDVECEELQINAPEVRVDTGRAENPSEITLISDRYSDSGNTPRLRIFGKGKLQISGPEPVYPWAEYRTSFTIVERQDTGVVEAYKHLCRILRGFRGSNVYGGTIGRSVQWIDGVAVGRTPMANALRDDLVDTGLLRIQGSRYVLDTEKAATLGIGFTNLRGATIPDLARVYLKRFMAGYQPR